MVVGAGGAVAVGDVDIVAAQGDLGLGQFEAELQHRGVGGVGCRRGGLALGGQAFEPAILARQGFNVGEVAAAAATVAQGDQQIASLIDVGRVKLEQRAEGIGGATPRVGAGGDRQSTAASRDGIGTGVVGKGRAEFAGGAGGGAELDAVLAPVARAGRPGGGTDPEAE